MTVSAIVLAAGAGTRMRSELPKPLHPICGRPMVLHVVHALERVAPGQVCVVVGHQGDQVSRRISEGAPSWADIVFATQVEQNGTGDATAVGLAALDGDDYDDDSTILLLPGDTPLLLAETIDALIADHVAQGRAATLLTSELGDPTGYGRVIRDRDGAVVRVVEQRDGSPDELAVREVNTSIYAFRRDLLGPALRNLSTDNAQGELYLTDVVESLSRMGHQVGAITAPADETAGVNDRWQLALAERDLRDRINRHWQLNGVTMIDPRQTCIDVDVAIGRDATLWPGTLLHGSTSIGSGCNIGPATELADTIVGDRSRVRFTVADAATIGSDADVGPFVHLGDGDTVADGATRTSN